PIIPIYHIHPQYGHPSPFVHETSQILPPGHHNSRSPLMPKPYAFRFPTRPLVWTPDPCSPQRRPCVPAPVQHQHQRHPPAPAPSPASSAPGHPPPPPHDPYAAAAGAAHSSGGCWPFYGIYHAWRLHPVQVASHQSPGTWPPMLWPTDIPVRLAPWLIPIPIDPYVPQLEWDVSKHPLTARYVTGAHVTIPLDSAGGGGGGARARE
ncbi:hypothetical protein BKA83DRAFT_4178648, partial [Pisolithus microcarpus]